MVPPRRPRVTTPARVTVDYGEHYDSCELLDEDDLHQGAAAERPNKKVIILLDMDCYEVQVWIKEKRPELENQDVPVVVVNLDKIILAVNYTARLLGVKRGNGRRYLEEMERKHPQLIVIETGELFGKQDCFTPQKKSDDIFQVLLDFQKLNDPKLMTIERSSKDEVYIDVTNLVRLRTNPAGSNQVLQPPQRSAVDQLTFATKTHPNAHYKGKPRVVMEGRSEKIYGSTLNYRILEVYPQGLAAYHADETGLAHGAVIAFKLIKLIRERTGFDASAGVAHNKLLAKLACDGNKPQGITIFTDISLPRVYKKLEFKGIPAYGGKRGHDLLTYFLQKGQNVRTLHDIISLPLDDLIAAFTVLGSSDAESDAVALVDKCRGHDDSIVIKRHFTETINSSINFGGTHYARTWDGFKGRVWNLSRDVAHRIKYSIERWNRPPQSLVVKATMRKGSNTTPSGVNNRRRIDGLVKAIAISGFIIQYIEANNLKFGEIEDIKVTVGDFQGSSEEEVANLPPERNHVTQSAAEGSGSDTSKSEAELKTMLMKFKKGVGGKTLEELRRQIGIFSEKIATMADYFVTMKHKCPSELVVNVTLFDGAGPKVRLTKEHSLKVLIPDLPEHRTINEFIMRYIEENHLEAPNIETVVVTLKGIQNISSLSVSFR